MEARWADLVGCWVLTEGLRLVSGGLNGILGAIWGDLGVWMLVGSGLELGGCREVDGWIWGGWGSPS